MVAVALPVITAQAGSLRGLHHRIDPVTVRSWSGATRYAIRVQILSCMDHAAAKGANLASQVGLAQRQAAES